LKRNDAREAFGNRDRCSEVQAQASAAFENSDAEKTAKTGILFRHSKDMFFDSCLEGSMLSFSV